MKSKLLLAVAVLTFSLANLPSAYAEAWPVPVCGNWNVLVAWDEEMASTSLWFYTPFPPGGMIPVSTKQYCGYQFARGVYRFKDFGIYYHVVNYVKWDSNDTLERSYEILKDCIKKIGFRSGMFYPDIESGEPTIVKGLVAFTNQKTVDNYGGIALASEVAVLIQYQTPWADDNIVMHEISHLHGCEDHYAENHCVMDQNYEGVIPLYWEPLKPVFDGSALLDLSAWADTIKGSDIHYEWCEQCKETITTYKNLGLFTGETSTGDEGLGPPNPLKSIGVWIIICGIIFVAVVFIVPPMIKKRKKPESKDCGKDSDVRLPTSVRSQGEGTGQNALCAHPR